MSEGGTEKRPGSYEPEALRPPRGLGLGYLPRSTAPELQQQLYVLSGGSDEDLGYTPVGAFGSVATAHYHEADRTSRSYTYSSPSRQEPGAHGGVSERLLLTL